MLQLSRQKFLFLSELYFFEVWFVYYRFSFGKGLVFGFQDTVNFFEVLVRLCAFSGGNDRIVGVGPRCGNRFLGIADPYNFPPAAIYAIML
jgi:hypothetical protein